MADETVESMDDWKVDKLADQMVEPRVDGRADTLVERTVGLLE